MNPTSIDSAFDSKLLAQVNSGDARAVGKIFDRYAGLAYNLALQVTNDASKAEQAIFQLFLRLWHEVDRFDSEPGEVKTRILQNAYVLARSQMPPSTADSARLENLTDLELDELLAREPAPSDSLEKLKSKVMETIEPEWPVKPPPTKANEDKTAASSGGWWQRLWPFLGFGFGIAGSALAVFTSHTARKLSQQLQASTVEANALRQDWRIAKTQLDFVLSPTSEVLTLTGHASAAKARGRVAWDPVGGQGFFIVSGLPAAPAGKTYQFWVIAGGQPVSVTTFSVDSTGTAQVRFADLPPSNQIFAFNVTLEPAGGRVLPNGEKLLSGTRL